MKLFRIKRLNAVRMGIAGEYVPPVVVVVTWVTSAGALPVASSSTPYSTTLAATTNDASPVTFTLQSGTLPTGLTLASSGEISGTTSDTASYSFTVRATSGSTFVDRAFTIESYGPPEWVTPPGTLGSLSQDEPFRYSLLAQ